MLRGKIKGGKSDLGTGSGGSLASAELWDLVTARRFSSRFDKGSRKSKREIVFSHGVLYKHCPTKKYVGDHNDCILLLPSFLATVSSYSYAELSFGCYYLL